MRTSSWFCFDSMGPPSRSSFERSPSVGPGEKERSLAPALQFESPSIWRHRPRADVIEGSVWPLEVPGAQVVDLIRKEIDSIVDAGAVGARKDALEAAGNLRLPWKRGPTASANRR